jgi:hypothetical protein
VLTQTFSGPTGLGDAVAFFDDHTLDLGAIADLVFTGDLNVLFDLNLTSGDAADSFAFAGILGNSTLGSGVPEPGTLALLGLLFGGLVLRRAGGARRD